MQCAQVDLSKVTIVPGYFDTSLPQAKLHVAIRKAAVIFIDCDLYESTVPVLDFLGDYIQEGTIMIFDDWFAFRGNPNRGEQRAFREWLERNPHFVAVEFHRFGWHSTSFIMQHSGADTNGWGDTNCRSTVCALGVGP